LNRLYPKSFLRLILIGFGLVSLPLIFALGYAGLNVQRLAEQSERAVRHATVVARASREMLEALTGMERALRQYPVIRDDALIEEYRKLHGEFAKAAGEYAELPLDAPGRDQLQSVIGRESRLLSAFQENTATANAELWFAEFESIAAQARALLGANGKLIDLEVERLRATAESARNTLLWQLLGGIPVAVIIALWFHALIGRQLRQLDRAIRSIGRAEYSDGVTVAGPQDLAYLGRRLDWLRRRLAELEEEKNRFLRHVSHDLKTPLTAIREGVQLLAEGVPGPLN